MRRFATTLAAAVVIGAAGCGGTERPEAAAPQAKPVGEESAGFVMQYADCGDWRAGSKAERLATVVALRDQLTPQRSAKATSPLGDERAYALLDKSCSQGYEALRLYKLYSKAQAFAVLQK